MRLLASAAVATAALVAPTAGAATGTSFTFGRGGGNPRKIECAGTLPDVATLYVTVRSGPRARTVSEHGACNKRFNRVYAALQAAAGGGE